MSANDLKTEANAAYAAQDWQRAIELYSQALEVVRDDNELAGSLASNRSAARVHLQQYKLALDDAKLAAHYRPTWATAQARCAEVYSRLQNFPHAEISYGLAIDYAEDDAARKRYSSARDIAKKAADRAAKLHAKDIPQWQRGAGLDDPNLWFGKLARAVQGGFDFPERGGLAVTTGALQSCAEGMAALDRQIAFVHPNGNTAGRICDPISFPKIVDCITADDRGFHFPPSQNRAARRSMHQTLLDVMKMEMHETGTIKYFTGRVWLASEIIDDLNTLITTKGRQYVRQCSVSLIRQRIVVAFLAKMQANIGSEVEQWRLAVELLDEGNRVWSNDSLDEKGHVFVPTIVNNTRCQLMLALMHAHRSATTSSAKRAFKLDDIEDVATQILATEIPTEFATAGSGAFTVAFGDLPRWQATAAFAYCAAHRAAEPLKQELHGKPGFANIDEAKKAAKLYDQASDMTPDDWHGKRQFMWAGLEMWLRAGGLTLKEVKVRVANIKRIDALISRFFGELEPGYGARDFALAASETVKKRLLAGNNPNSTLKPVPMAYAKLRKTQVPVDWTGYSGDVGLLEKLTKEGRIVS